MNKDLRRIVAPFVLGAAGLMLMVGAMAATDSTPRVSALTNCNVANFSLDAEELAFLTLINNYRQQNGLGALTISTNLNRAAHWMAWDLGTTPNWSHTDSLGRNPHQRAIDCGYPQGAGENLAAGTSWSTAENALTAWQNSSGHNANMLNKHYRQIGIARVYVQGSPYGWYWVTNFGATDDGTGGGGSTQPTSTPTQAPPTNTPTPRPATATPTNTPVPPTATPTTPASQGFTPPTATPTPKPNNPAPTVTSTPKPNNPAPTATPTPKPNNPAPTATPTPKPNNPAPTATPTPKPNNPAPTATPTAKPNNPAPTPTVPASGSLPLKPGSNLIAWTGQTNSPQVALKDVQQNISVVYGYNAQTKQWERYAPGLPVWVNTLKTMQTGKGYWIMTK